MISYDAASNRSPNVFFTVRCRVTRASASDPAAKIEGTLLA